MINLYVWGDLDSFMLNTLASRLFRIQLHIETYNRTYNALLTLAWAEARPAGFWGKLEL